MSCTQFCYAPPPSPLPDHPQTVLGEVKTFVGRRRGAAPVVTNYFAFSEKEKVKHILILFPGA